MILRHSVPLTKCFLSSCRTLDAMDTFSVSVNPYDHILSLNPSDYGIWISLRGSSILELWDPQTLNCRMLYDTRTDRYPQLRKVQSKSRLSPFFKLWYRLHFLQPFQIYFKHSICMRTLTRYSWINYMDQYIKK